MTFEADETYMWPQYDNIAYFNVTDDNINEADQIFILHLELENAYMNGNVLLQRRQNSLCRIIDNDRMFMLHKMLCLGTKVLRHSARITCAYACTCILNSTHKRTAVCKCMPAIPR